ncbi:MAG: GntR family transcriptional regulator [Hyphomicrobiales bacterium]|nr:GntR family transcriptional regulator [Hyphomicrobiales bacterium]
MSGTQIVRRNLHDEIAVGLREMIVKGELRPGEKVPEAALCIRFGVSRTPMREAFKALAAEGLLTLVPNRGAVVARITREEVAELFPVMGALEGLAGELACARITEAKVARIRKLHEQMARFYERGEIAPYYRSNRAIHEAIFEAADNAVLSSIFQNLLTRTNSVRFAVKKSPARWAEAVADHEAMLAALEARDGPGLGRILREHMRHKIEMVIEALDARDAAERRRS